jgi:hypothetical protein
MIADKFEADKQHLAEDLILGKAQDFADYKRICGMAAGLERSKIILHESINQLRDPEDDE